MNRISFITKRVYLNWCDPLKSAKAININTFGSRYFKTIPNLNQQKEQAYGGSGRQPKEKEEQQQVGLSSRQNEWNLPAIGKLIEKGVIELGPNGQPVFKPNMNVEPEDEEDEVLEYQNEKKNKDEKVFNPRLFSTKLEKNLDLDVSDQQLKQMFPGVSKALRRQLFEKLDSKAVQVLKRRPELGPRLVSTLGLEKGLNSEYDPSDSSEITDISEIQKKYKSSRVPIGWRKDMSLPLWKRQIYALREKFNGEAWNPRKKLSREAMEGIRLLKQHMPHLHSGHIAKMFKIPPESVRRILKTKWEPSEEEMDKMSDRWLRRSVRVKSELKKEKVEQRMKELKEKEDEKAHKEMMKAANPSYISNKPSNSIKRKPNTRVKKFNSKPKQSDSKPFKFTEIGNQMF